MVFARHALIAGVFIAASISPSPGTAHPARSVIPATKATSASPVARLAVAHATASEITLTWKNPKTRGFTGTRVRYQAGNKAPATPSAGTFVADLPKKKHSVTIGGLDRGTTYSFSVFAKYRHGRFSKPAMTTATTSSRWLTGVEKVVTTSNVSCALLKQHRVDCWGINSANSVGGGSTDSYVTAPVHVKGSGGAGLLRGAHDLVSDGNAGFCGLMAGGHLTCWGDNGLGTLGQGDNVPKTYPVPVKGVGGQGQLSDVTQVVGGYFGYCALLGDGGVVCWGNNRYGALGTGSPAASASLPVRVTGTSGTGTLGNVASLTRAGTTTCAILVDTTATCWGTRYPGSFGAPGNHPVGIPFRIPGVGGAGNLTGIKSLTLLGDTMCAVLTTAGAVCWGSNTFGVLGAGIEDASSPTPLEVRGVGGVSTLTGVDQIVGDGDFACARLTTGEAACWGISTRGQISGPLPSQLRSTVPRTVVDVDGDGPLTGVTELSVNFAATCAVTNTSGVVCWGANDQGQLGTGSRATGTGCTVYCSLTPVATAGVGGNGTLTGVAHLTANSLNKVGGYGYYAVLENGDVDFWGGGTNASGLFGTFAYQDFDTYSVPHAA